MEALLVLGWFAGIVLLGLLALPLSAALLAPLAGRGAGFAAAVGATVVTLVTFWIGHASLTPWTPLAGILALAALSAGAVRRGVEVPVRRYAEASLVLAAAFGFAVTIRAANPALTVWTETPLDYGILKSILRTTALPPEDVWFAGEPVQYYYGGPLTIAAWGMLTGVPARYLPNLAPATFYALIATGAYGLAGTLGARRGVDRRLAGAAGVFFYALAGNLATPARLLHDRLPAGAAAAFRRTLDLNERLLDARTSWFDAAHFSFTNTDFPLYGVFLQSFHGQLTSQVFSVLIAGLGCAYALTPPDDRRGRWVRLGAVVPVLGVVVFTNTWSVPLGVGLVGLSVAFAAAHPLGLVADGTLVDGLRRATPARREGMRYLGAVAVAVAVGAGALLVAAPFLLLTDTGRPIGLLPDRSAAGMFVVGYGGFLAVFGLYLWPRLRRAGVGAARSAGVLAGLVVAAVAVEFVALAFLVPPLAAGWWLLRRTDRVGFETVLIVAGAGLALAVELAFVRAGAEPGRFNTVYKVYSQVWLVWSIAAGAALAVAVAEAGSRLVARGRSAGTGFDPDAGALATIGVAAVVVLAVATYGIVFLPSQFAGLGYGTSPSLDALAFVEGAHPDHARAIAYLDARAGQPHIVEAVPTEAGMYRFEAAPASSLTGLPTIAGWTHAADYHAEPAYRTRRVHVRTIYEGPDARRAELLDAYAVEYVYLGPVERERYDVAALGSQPGIRRAYTAGDVTVYAVNRTALSGG